MNSRKNKKTFAALPVLFLAFMLALISFSHIEVNAAIAKPSVTSITNVDGGVKLVWGKVTGAEKYRVFFKSGSSWSRLGDTTSNTFTHTAVKSGTNYTYTVRCVSANGKTYTSSYNSSGWSIKYIAAPKVTKNENTVSGVKLTWDKVTGAEKYRVFVRSGSSWSRLGDTSSNTFTHNAAKSGTTYTYTVRCISANGKSYTSAYKSSGWSIKYIAAPQVTKTENTGYGVKLTWGKVIGAEKYRVFVKSGSSWTRLGDTTSTTFTHTAAKSGTTYNYTVRCISSDRKSYRSSYNSNGWSVKCVREVLPAYTITVNLSTGTSNSYNNMNLLNEALSQASDSKELIVKVKSPGTYYIASQGAALKIRSNTTLDLNGSTFIRWGYMYNFIQNCNFSGNTDGTGYTLSKNITIKNGTIDGSGGSQEQVNLLNLGHATGITIENVNFKNCRGGHLIELSGCKDCLVSKCTFTGFIGSAENDDNEAIQLDICNNEVAGQWNGVYTSDSTVCNNITVDSCTFYDYPSGVGNHHTIADIHNRNINITNNKFLNKTNTSQAAIWCYGFDDSIVSGNTVSGNYSCGIKVSAGNVDVTGNTIKNVPYDAVYITKSNSYVKGKRNVRTEEFASGCTVKNNTLSTSGAHIALSIFSGSGVNEISGNTISASGESAIVISGKNTAVGSIKSNTVKSTSAYGILVASYSKVTSITANTITGKSHAIQVSSNASAGSISSNTGITSTSGSGVYVTAGTATTINGNTIKNCKENGICISSTGVTSKIQSNSISRCGEYGIKINNSSLNVSVSKNTFSNNKKGSIKI